MRILGTLLALASATLVSFSAWALDSTVSSRTASVESLPPQASFQRTFTPHASLGARTADWGMPSLQRSAGANLNSPLYLSALMIALVPRVELGSSPLLWTSREHRWNATAKVNFYRSSVLDLGIGASASKWRFSTWDLEIQSGILAANYKPPHSRIWWGGSAGMTRTRHKSSFFDQTTRIWIPEYSLDASVALGPTDLTLGVGHLRDLGFSAFERAYWGAGATFAWYRPGKLISKPALGAHYAPGSRNLQFLFSTSFY